MWNLHVPVQCQSSMRTAQKQGPAFVLDRPAAAPKERTQRAERPARRRQQKNDDIIIAQPKSTIRPSIVPRPSRSALSLFLTCLRRGAGPRSVRVRNTPCPAASPASPPSSSRPRCGWRSGAPGAGPAWPFLPLPRPPPLPTLPPSPRGPTSPPSSRPSSPRDPSPRRYGTTGAPRSCTPARPCREMGGRIRRWEIWWEVTTGEIAAG